MTELQREAEARLCSSTAGFIVVGLVSLVLAALSAACIIALPAFTDEELKKIFRL